MSYRPWLSGRVLRQMKGLPEDGLDTFVTLMARVCDDPADPVYSTPAAEGFGRRVADLGDQGFIVFITDEDAGLIRVYDLVWTG